MQTIDNKFAVPKRNLLYAELAVCFFWLLYALHSTVLADTKLFRFQGLFYPLYLLMAVTASKNFFRIYRTSEFRLLLTLYYIFLCDVAFSLLVNQVLVIDFFTLQLVFMYSLGLLAIFQFSTFSTWNIFRVTTGITALLITFWLFYSYFNGSTLDVYRAGIDVNQNYVSTIICIGTIMFAAGITTKSSYLYKTTIVLLLIVEFYAMSLLASRGVSIALLCGLATLYLRKLTRFSTLIWFAILAIIITIVLPQLPGAEMLSQRFSYGDIKTLNDRTIIWAGCLNALEHSTILQLLFGFGFRSSEEIVALTFNGMTSTHNGYLRILVEQGLFGLALFLSMHALVIRRLWREGYHNLEALALLVTLMVINLSGSATDNFLYWIVFGAVSAIAFGIRSERENVCRSAA